MFQVGEQFTHPNFRGFKESIVLKRRKNAYNKALDPIKQAGKTYSDYTVTSKQTGKKGKVHGFRMSPKEEEAYFVKWDDCTNGLCSICNQGGFSARRGHTSLIRNLLFCPPLPTGQSIAVNIEDEADCIGPEPKASIKLEEESEQSKIRPVLPVQVNPEAEAAEIISQNPSVKSEIELALESAKHVVQEKTKAKRSRTRTVADQKKLPFKKRKLKDSKTFNELTALPTSPTQSASSHSPNYEFTLDTTIDSPEVAVLNHWENHHIDTSSSSSHYSTPRLVPEENHPPTVQDVSSLYLKDNLDGELKRITGWVEPIENPAYMDSSSDLAFTSSEVWV